MDTNKMREVERLEDGDDLPDLPNPVGRPRIELTEEMYRQASAMARMHCTAEEVCDVLGMSTDTLTLRLQERGYEHFPDFFKRYSAQGNASLRRLQWRAAEGGNVTAQIWLGKQWLGQHDHSRTELTGPAGAPLWHAHVAYSAAVMRSLEHKHDQSNETPGLEPGSHDDDGVPDPG